MKYYLIVFGLLCFFLLPAQNQQNIWYFGSHAGLDFSSGTPVALQNGMLDTFEGTASVSSADGQLLFYTDGVTVYDASHSVMMNGSGLSGSGHTTQSAVIVPIPGSSTHYLVFTLDYAYSAGALHYSEVDMTQNNGLGAVIMKNHFLQSNCTEKISAVYHQNMQDIWIIIHERDNNVFKSYLVTSAGVSTTAVVSGTGPVINGYQGCLKASRDGSMLAMATYHQHRAEVYNFDKSSGSITYNLGFGFPDATYGAEFSSDMSKLYISVSYNYKQIYQVDLAANTSTLIATPAMAPGALQMGPDGKIYVARYDRPDIGSIYLGVIHSPDASGAGCNYVDEAVYLGTGLSKMGLPTFPTMPPCEVEAGFYADSACSNELMQFFDISNASIGYIQQWIWNFGDGSPADTILAPGNPNVQHLFPGQGEYMVSLRVVSDEGCSNVTAHPVVVLPIPVAAFIYQGNCVNQSVQFMNTSLTNGGSAIVGWQWNFGDPASGINNTSTLADPVHTYASPNAYQVTLIVTNMSGCSDTLVQMIISSQTYVEFSHTNACVGEAVFFSPDTLLMNPEAIATWLWEFGDGTVSVQSNPQHVYNQSGTYFVTLSVVDTSGCSNSVVHPLTVALPPVGLFSYSEPDCIHSPVQFTDLSDTGSGRAVSWHWDFGDGQTSVEQNPLHSFGSPGSYIVCLIIQNECGQSFYCHRIFIESDPVSNFSYSYPGDMEVAFTNQSSDESAVHWDFGDGETSEEFNPVHAYAAPAMYWVCLSAINACAQSISCKLVPVPLYLGVTVDPSVSGISLFPNPASDHITIRTNGLRVKQAEIFTSTGVLTGHFETAGTQPDWQLTLKGNPPGMYWIRFLTDKGFISRKLIIQ